jgi:hypothetical protein
MKNASISYDGSLSNVPPTCHVLPTSQSPDDSCHCVACPHGYGSRGGVINMAECIPQLHFYLRLALTTTEATPACNPAVSAAVTQALADALRKNNDILPGDSSAEFLGCCSDSQVCCWHVASQCLQPGVRACVRACVHTYTTHVCTPTHYTRTPTLFSHAHICLSCRLAAHHSAAVWWAAGKPCKNASGHYSAAGHCAPPTNRRMQHGSLRCR